MSLNSSGAISLAGPVTGQSIALELALSPTAVISLNDTVVRTLAGTPTGAIVMPTNFWGKSGNTSGPFGCATYTTAGTYSFVVPTGVSKICVVCVAGGSAGQTRGYGGGGGALSYTNCIPTTSGETLIVTVGVGGAASAYNTPGGAGGPSSVKRGGTTLISAAGTALGSTAPGGQASCGIGAVRYSGGSATVQYGPGGGAAGFSGNGGNSNSPGQGGGGAGGFGVRPSSGTNKSGAGGGGVGLIVAGPSGVSPAVVGSGGGGGSGGTPGASTGGIGGNAGGGAGTHQDNFTYPGGVGGVRIIYGGINKTYPNNSAP
jgi:hypothetical protein